MKKEGISRTVISRLPRYYRFLCKLEKEDIKGISSQSLADLMGLTASQIRQDFSQFGDFGHQGYGYPVSDLKKSIGNILGINDIRTAVLIGAGNLGRAVASRMTFTENGFKLIGIFDSDKIFSGMNIRGIPISPDSELRTFCLTNKPDMAILCIPENSAEETVDKLMEYGITNFWNFTHFDISRKYPGTTVENVHLSDSMLSLAYYIKNKEKMK